ncbi:MAG: class I SAM-dependent methyltransferase, partial [Catalinimonas sp.]
MSWYLRFRGFEFEDLPWFPAAVRAGMTDFLDFAIGKLRVYRPAVPMLQLLLDRAGTHQLVDLCSG